MKPVTVRVEIGRPAAQVFAYLEAVENNTRWLSGMRSCRWTSEPPVGVGSTYEQVATFMGKQILTSFQVDSHEPGRQIAITSMPGSSFPIRVTRRVDPAPGERSRVTEVVESDPSGFYRIAAPLLGLMVRRRIRRDYGRLKTLLESDGPAGA